jgi:acyl-CoA synthetase (AMP-forming)/AMP-acid ligase II
VIHAAVFTRKNDVGIDQVWGAVTASETIDLAAIAAHCARALPALFVPVKILQVRHIPLNEMGRPDRKSLPDLAAGATR